jgi:hypothetical protein
MQTMTDTSPEIAEMVRARLIQHFPHFEGQRG